MKKSQSFSVVTFVAILILTLEVSRASNGAVQHKVRIEEYRLFHEILHPLQHEALPQGDFRRIRLMARELVTRGKAIVKLGVPEAPKANRREFAKALRTFDRALAKFKTDARTGSNTGLKESYTAVHHSFEKIADLVPTVSPGGGMPPIVRLDCPSTKTEAGSKITLTAYTPDEGLLFTWAVSGGKIISGQDTTTITIDTTGLTEQTISVRVEVNDGFGFVVIANCEVQISSSKQLQLASGIHSGFPGR